jgi:hypothetical protein
LKHVTSQAFVPHDTVASLQGSLSIPDTVQATVQGPLEHLVAVNSHACSPRQTTSH